MTGVPKSNNELRRKASETVKALAGNRLSKFLIESKAAVARIGISTTENLKFDGLPSKPCNCLRSDTA